MEQEGQRTNRPCTTENHNSRQMATRAALAESPSRRSIRFFSCSALEPSTDAVNSTPIPFPGMLVIVLPAMAGTLSPAPKQSSTVVPAGGGEMVEMKQPPRQISATVACIGSSWPLNRTSTVNSHSRRTCLRRSVALIGERDSATWCTARRRKARPLLESRWLPVSRQLTSEIPSVARDRYERAFCPWFRNARPQIRFHVQNRFDSNRGLCETAWIAIGIPHPQKRRVRDFRKNKLPQRLFHLAQPVRTLKHFAWLGAVGSAYNAVFLHQVNQVSGASITDAQASLQQRR